MNKYIYTLPLLAATLTLSSCFKEEPLNSECDITHVSLHTDHRKGCAVHRQPHLL